MIGMHIASYSSCLRRTGKCTEFRVSGCKKDDDANTDKSQYGDGVTDINGNHYPSVIIGDQEWMAENLKAIKYKEGTDIPHITDGGAWSGLTTGAYCWNDNNYDDFGSIYGGLLNRG
jgi:hypothetical protein